MNKPMKSLRDKLEERQVLEKKLAGIDEEVDSLQEPKVVKITKRAVKGIKNIIKK